ncbi:MAG: hypothetical protein K6T56_11675 [Burkholderiales bacterium]|nr:hypothetical protein [Burkholderiales bacterium]
MYARGNTMRDIGQLMRELYGIEIYHAVISQITDGVLDEVPPGRTPRWTQSTPSSGSTAS